MLSLILASAPTGAAAQSHAAPSDPDADSPSGVVYELPLDQARKDAAPREGKQGSSGNRAGRPGESGSSSDPARSDTSIRSENNFGSSSTVPGVSGQGSGDGDRDRDASGGGAAGGSGGSGSGGAADGSGSGSSRAEELATRATANPIANGGGPSDSVVVPLVAALLAVGAAIGIIAGRRSRTLRRRGI